MLKTMIASSGDFVEKKEKRVIIPHSSEAVEDMVKFFYGFELVHVDQLNTLLELIEMAGVYGVEDLDSTVAEHLRALLTEDNVFQTLAFAFLHKAPSCSRVAALACAVLFTEEETLSRKEIKDNPNLAIELWTIYNKIKKIEENSNIRQTSQTPTNSNKSEEFWEDDDYDGRGILCCWSG